MSGSSFPRPVLVISKCLGFGRCRYNGEMMSDPLVERLKACADMRPVCPEMEIGLGVPRDPIRIVRDQGRLVLYQPSTGRDITADMNTFTERYLSGLPEVDGFILKSRSPSCGPAGVKVHAGFKPGSRIISGAGFFAAAVSQARPGVPVEDEGRLTNFTIREHFLTRIFTRARFREIAAGGRIRDLVEFQARHKYLFLAVDQAGMRRLGRIVAGHGPRGRANTFAAYGEGLDRLFSRIPSPGSWINVLQHAFGYVSSRLNGTERTFFQNLLEEYRDERIPLSAPVMVIRSWAMRFDDQYLLGQAFLDPYPSRLRDQSDSGRGRKGSRSS